MRNHSEKRPYHSPQRQEQARRTRRQILEAARRLFGARGYAATTLPAIAREAGVSPPTITAVFGTKPALLEALVDLVVRGDAGEVPLAERAWWKELLAEPDPGQQLRRHAAITREVHHRSADVAEIVRGAATVEPEIAALLEDRGARRLQDTRLLAESLAQKGGLRQSMTVDRATDLIWALSASDLYRLLVTQRGWSLDGYEEWLASSLVASLLDT